MPVRCDSCAIVSDRFCCVKPWITASPRASEVMKFGSPVIASMPLAAVGAAGGVLVTVRPFD